MTGFVLLGGGHGTRPSAAPDGLRTSFSPSLCGRLRTRACWTVHRTVQLRLCPLGSESHFVFVRNEKRWLKAISFHLAEDMGLEPTGLLHLT